MHGLPAAKEIIEKALVEAAKNHSVVKEIGVKMGPKSTISPEELDLCFQVAATETSLKDAVLKVTEEPGLVTCRDCHHSEMKTHLGSPIACPKCFNTNLEIGGEGIVLTSISFRGDEL